MIDARKGERMRATTVRVVTLCAGLLLVGTVAWAQQVQGTVVNRNGDARSGCRVDFAGPETYSVWSNAEGAFFLESPKHGDYEVTVTEGDRTKTFEKVNVDQYGLHPSTLVVDW
jgi:hypothetical protein